MKTINVSEATKMQLNWLVATCEGWAPGVYMREAHIHKDVHGKPVGIQVPSDRRYIWFRPTIDWSQMGPIIERERISVEDLPSGINPRLHPTYRDGDLWEAKHLPHGGDEIAVCGSTYLIAAARCFCCAKLGKVVEVPEELCL